MRKIQLLCGDSRDKLSEFPEQTFQTVVTSPPYWLLRDYYTDGQLGMERTPEEYVDNLLSIMKEVKRVLRNDGILWLNIGDTYGGRNEEKGKVKAHNTRKKDLVGIPWMVAFAMKKDGWILRQDVIWDRVNPLPDGAKDRPTRSHEYLFMFTKREHYFYDYYSSLEDSDKVSEGLQRFGARNQEGTFRHDQERVFEHYGKRNRRSVWRTGVGSFPGSHFAVFPTKLIDPCISTSTSRKMACAACGTPIRRILGKDKIPSQSKKGYELKIVTKGWEPICSCNVSERKRSIVLDPFAGTSTTGMVALKYDLDFVGIDINPNYINMSKNVLTKSVDMFTEISCG